MQTGEWDDSAWAPPSADEPGRAALLPGYRDFTQIARGGDSIVYRAHQDALDRDVAIKVVELDDAESISRFRRELAITVQLGRQHPNIMSVLATGTTSSGQPCLVMDYFELGSLQDRLGSHGPLPVSEVVAAGTVVADALSFAHAQGVLHRDIKPQNVLVLPTSWVLADFGLARAIDAGHSSSLERFSYRHASPQILDGESPTIADDIYSLGSTLFTLLDGRAPFAAEDADEDSALSYLRRARTERPRRLARDDIPPALRDIVGRCLSRERRERYADAGSLRDALESVPTESRFWAPDRSAASEPDVEPVDDPLSAFAPPVARPEPKAAEPESDLNAAAPEVAEPARTLDLATTVDAPQAPDEPARSALAQLPAEAAAARDPDATGLRPIETVDDEPPTTGGGQHRGGDDGGSKRTRWLLIAAAAVVALAAGVGIGIWRGSGGSPNARHAPSPAPDPITSPSTTPSQTGIPTTNAPPTSAASYALVEGADPKITLYARNSATSVTLSWTDASKGQYSFVIFEVTPSKRDALTPVQAGRTSATIPRIAPGRHCLQVGMLVPADNGGLRVRVGPQSCKTT